MTTPQTNHKKPDAKEPVWLDVSPVPRYVFDEFFVQWLETATTQGEEFKSLLSRLQTLESELATVKGELETLKRDT